MTLVLAGIAAYVLAQLAIGFAVSRRIATEDDYLVAGRRLGPLLAGGSIFATWFGAETCVSAAGQVHAEGLGAHTVEPYAYGVCLLLGGLLFAVPFWRAGVTTIADLLRRRFGHGVERLAALLLIPTSVLWAAAQVRAFGSVLASSSSLSVDAAIAVAALVAVVYTVAGGLLADVYTDIVQCLALVAGLLVVLVSVAADAGGVAEVIARLGEALASGPASDPLAGDAAGAAAAAATAVTGGADMGAAAAVGQAAGQAAAQAAAHAATPSTASAAHLAPGGAAGWLLTAETWAIPLCGSVLAQEVLSRCLAARSAAVARGAMLGGGAAYLLFGSVPVVLGLLAPDGTAADSEHVLPALARLHLSDVGYVVFAGALVSAILSTVDSALLAATAFLSRNLLLSGRAVGERGRLRVARGGVALFGLLAWWLAASADGIFELIEEASGFGSAGILVVVCAALFARRTGAVAAAGALLAGVTAWIVGAYVMDDATAPYLASLACALIGFVLGAAWERGRERRAGDTGRAAAAPE